MNLSDFVNKIIKINIDFHMDMVSTHNGYINKLNKLYNNKELNDIVINPEQNDNKELNDTPTINIDQNDNKELNAISANIEQNDNKELNDIAINTEQNDNKELNDINPINSEQNDNKENNPELINTVKSDTITTVSYNSINALTKISHSERKYVISDIYKKASNIIKDLHRNNNISDINIQDEINKEANRLLDVYMKTH